MIFRWMAILAALWSPAIAVWAQSGINDILAGKLLNPKVGQWAWYDVTDGDRKYVLRQAVVGEERVGSQTGHWVELELVPEVGYPTVYKMLLTGPANDPQQLKKLYVREGNNPIQEPPLRQETPSQSNPPAKHARIGVEDVQTLGGSVRAEHVRWEKNGQKSDLWTSEKVPPCGIIRMQSPSGTMILRNYGTGGPYAKSVMDEAATSAPPATSSGRTSPPTKVEIKP